MPTPEAPTEKCWLLLLTLRFILGSTGSDPFALPDNNVATGSAASNANFGGEDKDPVSFVTY